MSTAVAKKLMTAEEFFESCHLPENAARNLELVQGEVEEMPRPGVRHGVVCNNGAYIFGGYTRRIRRGYSCANDTGLIIGREPDTVRGPDVFLYLDSKPYGELEVRYSEKLPDLLLEVLSPTDRLGQVIKRIQKFLEQGVQMVWLADPESCNITVFRPNAAPVVYDKDQELAGFDLLPDFRCPVSEFFFVPGA